MILLFYLSTLLSPPGHPQASPLAAHDFKMSVCEIECDSDEAAFSLKFYLFTDDLKAGVYGNPYAPKLAAGDVQNYILRHFTLTIDEVERKPVFQTMQEKNEQVQVQFTCPGTTLKGTKKITVGNTLLLEKFPNQVNMVYLLLHDRLKMTQMLHATRTEGTFSL